ncbi:outer membrane beta-barrel protein [Aliivibrio fischeri]|uniref:Outer membrane beta-barrel protein n=1 Tax=Aliivibrio fischeri TaxID=668 RepID=A0A844P5Y3_ALIFS|nr:outer membrane beta-barrel protein [Aliivibrio fischeri]
MFKILPLLVTLCSFSTFAQEANNLSQDIYVAGGYSYHEVFDDSGNAFDGYFGARNIYGNSLFIGGELEGKVIDNSGLKKKGLDEEYSFSANIPVGKRFKLNETLSIDAYGLIGYSTLQTKPKVDKSLHGVKYGVGIELNTSNWLVGIRYSRVNLDYDFDQKDISLLVGYKFKSLLN